MTTLEFKIKLTESNLTIRRFLQDFNVGKQTIYKYSSNHLFEVNYKPVNSEYRLKDGDLLRIHLEEYILKDTVDVYLDIVYEDDDIFIVSKPIHLIVHDDGTSNDNLTHMVNSYFNQHGYYHQVLPVHRIDKDTSGIVVFAKHFISLAYMSHLFESRQVKKKYICVVENKVKHKNGYIESKLKKDNTLQKMIISNQGKLAKTSYELIRYEATRTRLMVEIETGRTHQIRAHLASINHPVVGDTIYGVSSSRLLLHFYYISFPMLRTKKIEYFVSNPSF